MQVFYALAGVAVKQPSTAAATRRRSASFPPQAAESSARRSGLKKMDGKGVSQRILTLPMNQAPPQPPFTTVTIRFTANT